MQPTPIPPRQRHVLLVVILVALGVLVSLGLRSYVLAFLGAGVLYVVMRPWLTAWSGDWRAGTASRF